jgi:hypothetical protein
MRQLHSPFEVMYGYQPSTPADRLLPLVGATMDASDVLSLVGRLLASAARSWSGGTGIARGRCQMPPHLLMVSAGNSRDLGPTPQAEGQAGGAVAAAADRGGNRGLQPSPPVFS